ncbi:MAG: ECF-type sigma factor, partial [Planctomycetota bacterium]
NRVDQLPDIFGSEDDPQHLVVFHDLITKLGQSYPRPAEVAKLRILLQMTHQEIGAVIGISDDVARTDWMFARAWLRRAWGETSGEGGIKES